MKNFGKLGLGKGTGLRELAELTDKIIADKLAKINTEYRNTLREQGDKALPKVKFVNRGYFDKGIKISYV